jgi:hypothetical protein
MVASNTLLAMPYVGYVTTYGIYEFTLIYLDLQQLRCFTKR